jgi:hypothetical protein
VTDKTRQPDTGRAGAGTHTYVSVSRAQGESHRPAFASTGQTRQPHPLRTRGHLAKAKAALLRQHTP